MRRGKERLELDMKELEKIIERAALDESDRKKLKAAIETLAYVTDQLEHKQTSINRLRKLLFGSSTEKTKKIFAIIGSPTSGADATSSDPEPARTTAGTASSTLESDTTPAGKPKRKGHGRNAAEKFRGANKITVAHESLHHGDACPKCKKGKVYRMQKPKVIVRITGQAPIGASLYELEKFRCGLCGEVFVARAPPASTGEKYDARAAAMIGVLKYGAGLPFNRLEKLQAGFGIPLPAATQWDNAQAAATRLEPTLCELIRQAAQGEVLHNDDTTAKILALMSHKAGDDVAADEEPESERTGMFTSGIVATRRGARIALFFTGRKHAGENLVDVLAKRATELGPPIQMCDALSRNMPEQLKTILSNCLAHARRKFTDLSDLFPAETRHVVEVLRDVYRNDDAAVAEKMSPEQRLAWHQHKSAPLMNDLQAWMKAQVDDKLIEPNSALGDAFEYMTKHWQKLTLFLRVAGAPLDNNLCERAMKKAILHRKNALFFRTENGAHVADVFMSLIHTAELNGVDPFPYLVALLENHDDVVARPANWMPWNYTTALRPAAP
jgi:transposase